jgi:4-hydroxy-tetrahydrodipicolinate synthase
LSFGHNPSCVRPKQEDWPGLEKISSLRRFEKEGKLRRVPSLTGNGGLFLDFEMERGVDGAMTGYAFPEMLIDVVRLSREGRRARRHSDLKSLATATRQAPIKGNPTRQVAALSI